MIREYTKEEIIELIKNGKVGADNFNEIIKSLSEYEFNDVRDVLEMLSNLETVPLESRENLKTIIENNDVTMEETKEDSNVPKEEKPFEGFVKPEISSIMEQDHDEIESSSNYASNNDDLIDIDESISLENDVILGALKSYAAYQGIKVVASNPGINNNPSISLELDEVSKPYIDNLLLQLYPENENNLDVNLKRNGATKQEVLTISLADNELSQEELIKRGQVMFSKVQEILKNTDENKDYEAIMPKELQTLKDKFVNDDPNIPNENFKVGYSHKNGEKSFYLITDSKEQAIELAELMGYEVKQDRGGNVYELNTDDRNMEGSKLDKVTESINEIDEVKDTDNGISDVDINYNNKHYSEEDGKIINFINDVKDPSNMAIVQVDIPESTPNQRIVHLSSSDGVRETIVVNDGKDFDSTVLPKMTEAFGENSVVDTEGTKKVFFDNGSASYEALSNDNTYLRLNNYPSPIVNEVDNNLKQYGPKEESLNNEKSNQYSKTLGTYPTKNTNYNEEAAKTSYAPIIVFILISIIGIILIAILY